MRIVLKIGTPRNSRLNLTENLSTAMNVPATTSIQEDTTSMSYQCTTVTVFSSMLSVFLAIVCVVVRL